MKNNKLKLTLKYTFFMSVVLVTSLIIIYIVSDRARHESFQGTLRSEAITKANLFLENKVDVTTMQHIYLNNTQFINEVEVALYTPDFKMLYHDAAEHDIVKETHEMIRQICEKGEMSIEVDKGYQAVGILYKGKYVVTAAAHDGYGEANMAALRNTLLLIFLVSILLMVIVGYILATLTIRPIERALTSQKMFASNVSHELRTPLAAIMGELGLALQRERTAEDYQKRIGRALDDASGMSDTIIGLLNLARAEYDASQIKMEPVRIDELLMNTTEELLRAKPEYRATLSFSDTPSPDEEISVTANRYLLALAFRNLIENNCKYSHDHTCNIAISRGTKHNGDTGSRLPAHLPFCSLFRISAQAKWCVTFSDKGQGMSITEQKNLFSPFYRGSGRASGHGIGMALVWRIVTLHGFTIRVNSKQGHGTSFHILLN